jgi:hypothetical protein
VRKTANPRIWTPPNKEEADRKIWHEGSACSRISGIVSGLSVARADMESASTEAPIVATGEREAATRVIGVSRCGGDPGCHGGRSVSAQSMVG